MTARAPFAVRRSHGAVASNGDAAATTVMTVRSNSVRLLRHGKATLDIDDGTGAVGRLPTKIGRDGPIMAVPTDLPVRVCHDLRHAGTKSRRRQASIAHGARLAFVGAVQCIRPVSSQYLTLGDGRSVQLVESLGRGSAGAVYRGVLESGWGIRRAVAVKLLDVPAEADHDEIMRQLGDVARRASGIRHPSVISLLELDRTDSPRARGPQPFLVYDLVEGESLASLVAAWQNSGHRVPIDFALVVTLRVAEALGAALFSDAPDGSLTGLAHGDLSPRQVLISSLGEVKVGDFGLGALYEPTSNIRTRTRLTFTAPEVACGAAADARADVFSLGAILHELLVGPRFAPGTDMGEAARMVRDGHFHHDVLEPNLPRELRAIIARAVARNPMDRYPHGRSIAFDLRREMLRLGLLDAQTCIRHAVVGWCEVRSGDSSVQRTSEVVPVREEAEGHFWVARTASGDTEPSSPRALKARG